MDIPGEEALIEAARKRCFCHGCGFHPGRDCSLPGSYLKITAQSGLRLCGYCAVCSFQLMRVLNEPLVRERPTKKKGSP